MVIVHSYGWLVVEPYPSEKYKKNSQLGLLFPIYDVKIQMFETTNQWFINVYMELRQNSGMDRPAVIQTYGSVWITCVLVWIGGMDRPVGSGYGSGLYILTRSHIWKVIKHVPNHQPDNVYSYSLKTGHGKTHETWYLC